MSDFSPSQSHAFVEEFRFKAKASGPLTGLTFAVKDLMDIAGYKTGCGNPTWKDKHPPAVVNAICIDQLLYAGATCLGKTVSSQFAFDLIGENVFFETPLNPKAPKCVPGGSSSGSASAVACKIVDFALGTDTGGSVRVPASNCGIFGMRPSHDAISVAGVVPLAPSFDTVGILANSYDVLKKVASCLLSITSVSGGSIHHIYMIDEAFQFLDSAHHQAFSLSTEKLRKIAKLSHISMRTLDHDSSCRGLENWFQIFKTIQFSEIWSSFGSWIEAFQPELGEKIEQSFRLAKEMDRSNIPFALSTREIYFNRLHSYLGPNDLLCMPTTPSVAPLKGSIGLDRTKDPYYQRLSTLNSIAGIGRLPQISVPLIEVDGKPIGLSFLAAHGNDQFLLQAIEQVLID